MHLFALGILAPGICRTTILAHLLINPLSKRHTIRDKDFDIHPKHNFLVTPIQPRLFSLQITC